MKLFDIEEVKLEREIREASQHYYENGTSEYTDAEFDAKLHRLKELNPNNPLLTETGHGYNVNATKGIKIKHKYGKAGSLGKAYAINEIPESIMDSDLVQLSLKLDGLSIVLYYINGILDRALTRGNGDIGIDKTDRISLIVPATLYNSTFSGAIRGELIFNEHNWLKFLERHPDAKNPRNSAAGLINADEFDPDEFKLLDFVAYTILGAEWDVPMPTNFAKLQNVDEFLHKHMPHVVPSRFFHNISKWFDIDTLKAMMLGWIDQSGYRADGMVLKDNNIRHVEHVNCVEYQYDAIAFKFESEIKETKVVDVEWNLSKTQYLIPTVIVEPIELAGTTVTRATGYNAKYINDNKIDEGAIVKITKCGEIIPNITDVVCPANMHRMPMACPSCGELLIWNGVHLMCKNDSCKNAKMQDLIIWCKNIAPMDGFKDASIAYFLTMFYGENASISTIMENEPLFAVRDSRQVGKAMFFKMINKVRSDDAIPIKSALLALNIPRLGDITCGKLSSHITLIEKIIRDIKQDMLSNDVTAELRTVVGDATTDSILTHFDKLLRFKMIADRILYVESNRPSDFKGEVVVTGKLSVSRKDFENEIYEMGFIMSNTVNKSTLCLITDTPNGSSAKNKKATELGIPKLSESEFREKYL